MQIIYEFIQKGSFVRVAAVDVKTGTEAIVIVPPHLSKKEMENVAYKKLMYLLKRDGLR